WADRDGGPRRQGPGDRGRRPPAARAAGEQRANHRPDQRGDHRPERRERRGERPEKPSAPRSRRLTPGDRHRSAVLESLPPEHRPVAEQVLRGGIPAVRQAVEAQNAKLRSEGQPEVHAASLVGLAEQLLPRLSQAEWRDRAEAAAAMLDDVSLRDLRSVVAGADAAARDDETRLLASTLREALQRRVAEHRDSWLREITAALDEGRLVRALRLSARPPDPGTRFPPELAARMAEAAGAALAPDVAPDRWATVLEAVAESPVRRSVKPAGLPAEAGAEVLQAARQASGRVPALAPLLGIDMPPPPGPPRPRPAPGRAPRPPRPPRPRPTGPEPQAAVPPPPPGPEPSPPVRPAPEGSASDDDVEDAVLVEELGQAVDKS
ncbi:MAG TPA: hypothetical protein VHE80_01040, partial [Acidimicrobiales bacterium]|nr:hypothetical protein [Acidimicrobiales bacterium]